MFTATWPKEVERLARDFLKNPIQLNIGEQGVLNANKSITQNIKFLSKSYEREQELFNLLNTLREEQSKAPRAKFPKTIIFVSTKASCNDIADSLHNEGYAVDTLHGDMSQYLR